MNVNARQSLFVLEYLKDLNATQAAIRAGYSAKNADVVGPRLLGNVGIRTAIEEKQKKREQRTEITVDRVLKELACIAFAKMEDYVVVNEDGSIQAKTWEEMPEGASRAVSEVKEVRRIMSSGKGSGDEVILECRLGYKHHNKEKALELLGNHLGMWKNINENTFKDGEGKIIYPYTKETVNAGDNGNGNGKH